MSDENLKPHDEALEAIVQSRELEYTQHGQTHAFLKAQDAADKKRPFVARDPFFRSIRVQRMREAAAEASVKQELVSWPETFEAVDQRICDEWELPKGVERETQERLDRLMKQEG